MDNWKSIETAPENREVLTKIHDIHGERNIEKLTRRGRLWYTDVDPNKGMYVYYSPTHWKEAS